MFRENWLNEIMLAHTNETDFPSTRTNSSEIASEQTDQAEFISVNKTNWHMIKIAITCRKIEIRTFRGAFCHSWPLLLK